MTVNQSLEGEREADPALPRFFFFFTTTHIRNFCHLSPEYCFLSQYRISYRVTDARWKAIEREEKGHFVCVRSAKGARGRRSRTQIPFLLAVQSHPVKAQEHWNLISVMHYGPPSNTQNFYVFRYHLRYAWSGKHKNYSILHAK